MPQTSFSSKMARMDAGGERIGINGAAALLDVTPEKVRRFVQDGRLRAERGDGGEIGLALKEVLNLARGPEAEAAEGRTEERRGGKECRARGWPDLLKK